MLYFQDFREELDVAGPIFQWLYSLSFNWSLFTPFVGEAKRTMKRRTSSWKAILATCNLSNSPVSNPCQSPLKVRLLEAVSQLANKLSVSVEEVGHLYDCTLMTGTYLNIQEFLSLSESSLSRPMDVEMAMKATGGNERTGLMLFLVRDIPEPTPIGSFNDEGVPIQAPEGFRFTYMRRLRTTLAEATASSPADVDKIVLGCRNYMQSGTRPILEGGSTHVALLAQRVREDGDCEVLVYDFAKHQVRIFKSVL